MRKAQRQRRAEGMDLGGSQLRSRFEELEAAAQDAKQSSRSGMRGSEPMRDPRHGGVAHEGTHGAPTIYTERRGGRAGGRGKRVGN